MPLERTTKRKATPSGESIEPNPKPEPVEPQEPQGPRVSAVFVAYNQGDALRRAIEALGRSQNRERLEILVVDCASSDGSSLLDVDFPSINLLRLPHHLGSARAMNIATRTAKGELILYLSPNVEVEPSTIAALVDRLDQDPDAAAVCPLLVDADGNPVSRVHPLPDKAALSAAIQGGELPLVPLDLNQESITIAYPELDAILIRKQFIRGMNYFDERYGHYWADADLAMQVRRGGKKIRLYPGIRAIYRAAPDPIAHESLAKADRIVGAAAFVGKYEGAMAGFMLRLGASLSALARFDLKRFGALLGGQKLDGSQAA